MSEEERSRKLRKSRDKNRSGKDIRPPNRENIKMEGISH